MPNYIPDEGSQSARIVLIGEAGGSEEDRLRRPFVGPSGNKLADWWAAVGLSRADFFLTNVWPYQPPGNKIMAIGKHDLQKGVTDLWAKISAMEDPWLIVPTGNTAFRGLLNRKLFDPKSPSITDYRGSILTHTDGNGRVIKMIPTIHPAAVFRSPYWEARCLHDWARIAEEAKTKEIVLPTHDIITDPSEGDIHNFYWEHVHRAKALTIDIETDPKKGIILCVGFAPSPTLALVIPTIGTDRLPIPEAWDWVRLLCGHFVPKVLQNGMYDAYWLKRVQNIEIANWQWDTLAMHHALDPCEDHDLAYLASIYTHMPFWKKEAKDAESQKKYTSDYQALLTYCGLDCVGEYQVFEKLRLGLERLERLSFYQSHYQGLFQPILSTMLHGIKVDLNARRKRHVATQARCIQIQDSLQSLAGRPLHGKKDLSNKKVQDYLYQSPPQGLGLPKQRPKGKKKTEGGSGLTADETALRRLRLIDRIEANDILDLLLEHRSKYKLLSFLTDKTVDSDGRLRCQYKFTTETGRFSSSTNPMGTGQNLQNIDRTVRDVFLPD